MAITDILNYYEEVQEDLKFQNISSIRIKIMISLSEGQKRIEDLQKSTGIPSSAILHSITELEKYSLVVSEGDYYHLSGIGKERVFELIEMIKTLTVLKNYRKLWLDHEIDAIPNDLLMKIGDLSNSKLIEAENANIDKVFGTYAKIVLNSREVRGVSPIFHSDWPKIYMIILEKGIKVDLILTSPVLKKTLEAWEKDLNKLISTGNLTLWEIKEDVKVGLIVTDTCLSLGLFSANGTYDSTKDLISDDEAAVAWGNRLFDYYLKRAQKVDLKDWMNKLSVK